MKNFSLQKKMVLQIIVICTFLTGISAVSIYLEKQISSSYRMISSDEFPKVESLSKMIANFRLIRIKVRTLGLTGNTKDDQEQYINDTKNAIGTFLKEKNNFEKMDFSPEEMTYIKKMDKGWNSFLSFGKDLLSNYENPTKESLIKGSNMIRVTCPIEANKWMSVAQSFLKYQSERTQKNVATSMAKERKILLITFIALTLSFTLSIVMGFLFSRSISNKILSLSGILQESANNVKSSSESFSSNSVKLSDSSNFAASSLQRTASAMDEINSMIQKNTYNAKSSTNVSDKSTEAVNKGKDKVNSMIESINDISESNNNIAQEMEKNNKDVSQIITVISEIGDKTKVINDIVFQTKLLSFNASVEAARAGEHGKGFAVVAEEVGNLASMSGNAAFEISEMLDKSIDQVTNIVEGTKEKVEKLVLSSKEKVNIGTRTAEECSDSLNEILKNVSTVNDMVRDIAQASSEQSTGVQSVTESLQELDQTSSENDSMAKDSLMMAENLNKQANSLDEAVNELIKLATGKLPTKNNESFSKKSLEKDSVSSEIPMKKAS